MSALPARKQECTPDCMIDGKTPCEFCQSKQSDTQGHRDTETQRHTSLEGGDIIPFAESLSSCVPVSLCVTPSLEFVQAVFAVAETKPLPAIADNYYLHGLKMLVALCAELQFAQKDKSFFLTCRDAGAVLGVPFRSANRWLNKLESDGVLSRVKTGHHKGPANEYFYVAD